ncbi:hypothetical protein [Microbacterium sp. NPDC055683]
MQHPRSEVTAISARLHIDTRALTTPVSGAEVRAFATLVRAGLPKRVAPNGGLLAAIGAMLLLVVLVISWPMVEAFSSGRLSAADIGILAIGLLAPLTVVALWVWVTVRLVRQDRRRYRLHLFARDNGWRYAPWAGASAYAGMYAAPGAVVDVFDRIEIEAGDPIELGTYRGKTGSGRSTTIRQTDYVRVPLGTALPHIVLDARLNDRAFGRSNLPLEFAGGQQLVPEGPTADAFRLYCPAGYEADALYLFSPDVLAVMLDHARDLDVEIRDDALYLCAPRGIVTTDPDRWRSVLATVEAITVKTRQWENWRDERLGRAGSPPLVRPRGVAKAGRRLRERSEWWWIVLGVIGLGYGLWAIMSELAEWIASL